MKKFLFSTLMGSLFALLGCQEEVLTNEDNHGGKMVSATATIQGAADSRVALTPGTDDDEHPIVKVDWNESGEQFYVVEGSQAPSLFTQTSDSKFEGTLSGEGGALHAYYGYTKSGSKVKYDISTQDGTLNGKYMLMEAYSDASSLADDEELSFKFKHTTAILKLTFKKGNSVLNKSITSIVMNNTKNSKTSGSNKTKVTVNPKKLEDIYVFLPTPMENIAEGTVSAYPAKHKFTFSVAMGERNFTGTLTIPADMSIEAGKLYTATVKLSEIFPYVTFSSDGVNWMTLNSKVEPSPCSISMAESTSDYGLQYSVNNGGSWQDVSYGDAIIFGGTEGKVLLRGNGGIGTAIDENNYVHVSFRGASGSVTCSGDIRTLVNYANYTTVSTANARFCGLFKDCTQLATAPALPATTLADHCYYEMFRGCTSLTSAPALPARTLVDQCYNSMFYGCTSLPTAPKLPATTLAKGCYASMFAVCKSLTSAPALPATQLAEQCYATMFSKCVNLTTAPEDLLPATTLVDGCYQYMFNECTRLESAPALPATTLANGCYQFMFKGCTSLELAPELPATKLKSKCYYSMFNGCTKLKSVTMWATTIPSFDDEEDEGCLYDWLMNAGSYWLEVGSTGTVVKPTIELDMNSIFVNSSEYGIPSGWTVKMTSKNELPGYGYAGGY